MPQIDIKKRPAAEKLLYQVIDALDPSGINTKRYRKMFATMSDAKFMKFMSDMFIDDTLNFTLDIEDYEREVNIDDGERACKILGVPVDEYLILPHLNMDLEHPIVSKEKCITGFNIEKRMQQTNQKKNSTSIHISERSAVTQQVVGHDKNGRSSDQENIGLLVLGADNILKELNGFRSDGIKRKNKAYSDIALNGICSLEEAEKAGGVEDKTALNTVDVMYMGMGIKTDLITPDLLLVSTLKKG